MNMMVNTSELVVNEAETNKNSGEALKNAVSKLVASWERKQAKKLARVGGLGFLAVSLAACNTSSDDTATTTTTTTTTITTPTVVADPDPVALTTTTTESIFGTTGNDSFTATQATYNSGDIIADSSSTDADTLTVNTTTTITATPTVVGIETVTFNATGTLSSGTTTLTVDVANISAGSQVFDVTNTSSLVAAASVSNAKTGSYTFSSEMETVALGAAADADIVINTEHSALNSTTGTNISTTGTADDLTINAGSNTVNVTASSATEDLTITSGKVNALTAAGILGDVSITSSGAVTITAVTNAIGSATVTNAGATDGSDIVITDMNSVTSANITSAGSITATANSGLAAATSITAMATESSAITADAVANQTLSLGANDPGGTTVVYTLNASTLESLALTGTTPVSVVVDTADITTETVTNTNTSTNTAYLFITDTGNATTDLTNVAANVFVGPSGDLAGSTLDNIVNLGTVGLDVEGTDQTGTVTFDHVTAATASTSNTLTFKVYDTITTAQVSTNTDVGVSSATLAFNDVDTLNIDIGALNELTNTAAITGDSLDKVVITGKTFTGVDFTGGTETTAPILEVDASALTGVFTGRLGTAANAVETLKTGAGADVITIQGAAASTNSQTIESGAGNDDVTVSAAASFSYDGGTGTDELIIGNGIDLSAQTITLTSVEMITLDGAAHTGTVKGSLVNGQSFVIKSNTAGGTNTLTVSVDSLNMDLSNLAFNDNMGADAADSMILDGSSSGIALTLTGTSMKDTITGGASGDNITAGEGTDIIDGKGGADTITLTETTAAIDDIKINNTGAVDTIVGFKAGAGGDKVTIDINDTTAGTLISSLEDGAGNSAVTAGETVNVEVVTGQETLDTDNIIVLSGDFTTTAAVVTAIKATGTLQLTAANTFQANDDIIVAYDDGSNTYLSIVNISATATTINAASTATNFALLSGVTDATTLHADNFVFG